MNTLCRIREVSRAIAEFEQCFEREYRLSMNEGVLLCCLARHGELSSGEIAEMLRLTCSNTSKVIRSVEGKGFVIRKLGEEDKRQMYFSLTEAGRAELERLQPCRVALPELLARLTRLGEKYGIPVAYCDDFGHGENHAVLPIGRAARLDTQAQTLRYL